MTLYYTSSPQKPDVKPAYLHDDDHGDDGDDVWTQLYIRISAYR